MQVTPGGHPLPPGWGQQRLAGTDRQAGGQSPVRETGTMDDHRDMSTQGDLGEQSWSLA